MAPATLVLGDEDRRDLERIIALVHRVSGIKLSLDKSVLIQNRLAKRMAALGCLSLGAYADVLEDPGRARELEVAINALTTNVTRFFRESAHFDHLALALESEETASRIRDKGRLRLWSAGCASGEEAYSIAMTVSQSRLFRRGHDIKILASDISSDILAEAEAGQFPATSLSTIPLRFHTLVHRRGDCVAVSDALKTMVAFRHLNLVAPWPMKGAFDIIFFRNVGIYFEEATRLLTLERMAKILNPGGFLYLGHSETVPPQRLPFERVAPTIFRRLP